MASPQESYSLTSEFVQVTLDGSGNGTARWTPGMRATGASAGGASPGRNSGFKAAITSINVKTSTNTLEASAKSFVSYGIQSNSDSDFIGQTQLGSTGDTCSFSATLRPGDWITTVWTGGDAGAIATMKIIGDITPPGAS